MIGIKRLDTFILKTFVPLLLMTFCICLFIVLMQFLWKYIDELVGKGLGIDLVLELFFYAAVTMVPMALPLSILLASLMVFGNLGEHFELTALKSSGISLIRVMAPLIFFICGVSIGAFFFQNDILPEAQVRMWTLMFSMRQKSPELDIPEGAFYDQITGYNLFVKHKNRKNGMLYNIMIYDVSKGYGFANVMLADSGKLSFTDDKKNLFFRLYSGEAFEDMKDGRPGGVNSSGMLFRRETFSNKEIVIPFDANFNRMDDQTMRDQYIGKNITMLSHTIDSVSLKKDSVGAAISDMMRAQVICGTPEIRTRYVDTTKYYERVEPVAMKKAINLDSLMRSISVDDKRELLHKAINRANSNKQDFEFRSYEQAEFNYSIRRHGIELQKKFTLSLACLIFFFIGAPLGAIIRKGGLGTPIVISVMLFIVYYVIDNTGYKMSRDGHWPVWQGIWLSSAVLLPLGIFLTYKAVNDSAVFNADAYRNFFARFFGIQQTRKLEMKEVVIDDVVADVAIGKLAMLKESINEFLARYKSNRQFFVQYWTRGYDMAALNEISAEMEAVVNYMANSRSRLVINKTMDFPILRSLLLYSPSHGNKRLGWCMMAVFPLSLPLYFVGTGMQKGLKAELAQSVKVCDELSSMLKD